MADLCMTCGNTSSYSLRCHSLCPNCAENLVLTGIFNLAEGLSVDPVQFSGVFDTRCQHKCEHSSYLPQDFVLRSIETLMLGGKLTEELTQVLTYVPDYFRRRVTVFLRCDYCSVFTGFYAESHESPCWVCESILCMPSEAVAKVEQARASLQQADTFDEGMDIDDVTDDTQPLSEQLESWLSEEETELASETYDIVGFLKRQIARVFRKQCVRLGPLRVLSDPDDAHFFDQVTETQLFIVHPFNKNTKELTVRRVQSPTPLVFVIEAPGADEAALMGISIQSHELRFQSSDQYLVRFSVKII